jgi:hypothetical protein
MEALSHNYNDPKWWPYVPTVVVWDGGHHVDIIVVQKGGMYLETMAWNGGPYLAFKTLVIEAHTCIHYNDLG